MRKICLAALVMSLLAVAIDLQAKPNAAPADKDAVKAAVNTKAAATPKATKPGKIVGAPKTPATPKPALPDLKAKPDKELTPAEKKIKARQQEMASLQSEYMLLMQKQKNELAKMELEKQAIAAKAALRTAKLSEELAEAKEAVEKLTAEAALQKAEQGAELAELKAEMARLTAEGALSAARRASANESLKAETEKLTAENALMAQQIMAAKVANDKITMEQMAQLAATKRAVELAEAKREAAKKIATDIKYRAKPLDKNTLYISDRRIALNSVIMMSTADYIAERIHFFNNQSKKDPIFIVIDTSPGGSVMAGYRILEAMDASEAPIHVVVKSFAASMAAAITTLADHSYAYPNAILLHHQMSSSMRGNLTQQKEQLENSLEWSRRLADPIAKKMGVSPKKFVEMMYEKNSNGDWEEFADRAVRLKWVDKIVSEIREEGIVEHPGEQSPMLHMFPFFGEKQIDADGNAYVKLPRVQQFGQRRASGLGEEQMDGDGNPYVKLPRLQPFDHWFLYDPDGYYKK